MIAEGTAEWHQPSRERDQRPRRGDEVEVRLPRLARLLYRAGSGRLAPVLVLAWDVLYQDATRFTFG